MSDSRQRLADHRDAGALVLEDLLRARDRDEIARLMRHLLQWRRELIALAKDHDPVALYFQNVDPTPQETVRIHRWYPKLRDKQRNVCNYVQAALVRLNAYLRQPDTRPKRPGRKKGEKLLDDRIAIAKARKRLVGPNPPPSLLQAAREVEPLADRGLSEDANIARVHKALRGL